MTLTLPLVLLLVAFLCFVLAAVNTAAHDRHLASRGARAAAPMTGGQRGGKQHAQRRAGRRRLRAGGGALHVTPNQDAIEHVTTPLCWCQPTEHEPGLWVHHSADGRDEPDAPYPRARLH